MKTKCANCCYPEITSNEACGCCEGVAIVTPVSTYNRPGLSDISYRIGTHGGFLESMMARLSSANYPELAGLTTRAGDDSSIALLDAWATIADVLTFYQERVANEGYLRTASERRSVLELARLAGYKLKPGVASSVFLAYIIDANTKEEVTIPAGRRVQSIPGPDELPQTFETSEDLKARAKWNNLKPRMSRPQKITLDSSLRISTIFLDGIATNLQPNDPLLLVFSEKRGEKIVRIVAEVNPDSGNDRTEAKLIEIPFLIVFAIELLRKIISQLNDDIKTINSVENPNQYKLYIEFLLTVLESFTLSNYPRWETTFFSHERIYAFLCAPNEMRRTLLYSSVEHSAIAVVLKYWSEILTFFSEKLEDFNPFLIEALEDINVQQEFVCFFRYVLQQLEPIDLVEKECLKPLLKGLDNIFDFLKDVGNGAFLPLIETITIIFQDPNLNAELSGFISDTLEPLADEHNVPKVALEIILTWLEAIPQHKDSAKCEGIESPTTDLNLLLKPLLVDHSIQPRHSTRLFRKPRALFAKNSDTLTQTVINFNHQLITTLYQAWGNASVKTKSPALKSVHLMGLSAPLFGYNAQFKMGLKKNTEVSTSEIEYISVPDGDWDQSEMVGERNDRVYLDNSYKEILEGVNIVIKDSHQIKYLATRAVKVNTGPRSAFNLSSKTTRIDLSREWWSDIKSMKSLRKTEVWVETAELSLAEEPYRKEVSGESVELDSVYGGLESGRWVVITGERSDIPGTSGVRFSELAMLSNPEQIFDENLPGDRPHTRITFAEKLSYSFKRDTVTIYGNVVKATHGETREEVLGSGDGSKALQSFDLKQNPLTHVSASNPSGVDSTLKVFINDIRWHEADTLADRQATDRNFITQADDEDKVSILFGNGKKGARLPTGIENIKAEYRSGIGKAGNVKAEQISLLQDKPLGVKEVINPLRASGGANREGRDQARNNAPLAVKALDRLVSVQDYEDFSRTYAGIGKARAEELTDGRRQLVHVTVAGADDIPIDTNSDLYRNLRQALYDFGDPFQPIELAVRELMLIVISAKVHILPDYQWEPVVTQMRTTLLDAFSFERRELGQDVVLSEVISVMQAVRGVAYVDVDTLGGIPEKIEENGERRLLTPDEISEAVDCLSTRWSDEDETYEACKKYGNVEKTEGVRQRLRVNLAEEPESEGAAIRPAQLAFLTPDVPVTLILNRIE